MHILHSLIDLILLTMILISFKEGKKVHVDK